MIDRFISAEEVCRQRLALMDSLPYHIGTIWRAESFRATEGQPMTLRRAAALNAVLEHCDLPLVPGELLLASGLGHLAPAGDADALCDAQQYLATIGSRTFNTNADHTAPGYAELLSVGLRGLKAQAGAARQQLPDTDRRIFLESVLLALNGASEHIRRWATEAELQAGAYPEYEDILTAQAEMLAWIAEEPPRTLWEAMQLVLLVHSMFQMDERAAMAIGRVDQFLYPLYQADLAAGRITPAFAQALFDHFFAKLAHRWDTQNVATGGVDREGRDATNELSFMCLEAVQRSGQPGGNLMARINAHTPEPFLRKCAEVIRTGIGFPAVFNDEVEIPALVAQGYALEDARDYCFVGCIEVFIPGKQAPWSDSRFCIPRCVNLALWNGVDDQTGAQAGLQTGDPRTWDDFYAAFKAQMEAGMRAHVAYFNAMQQAVEDRAADFTSPLMSALVQQCIARGLDQCMGGAVYPSNLGVAGMGIGTTADSLLVIKRFVYEQSRFTLNEMRAMLAANFVGYEAERRLILDAPKYGNDDTEVDALAMRTMRDFALECLRHRTVHGGQYWALMGANVSNIYSGREMGATPDGRLAQQPISDAASPTFGRDVNGPTAVVKSVAKLDYALAPGGNVINMKFHPSALAGEEGLAGLAALIRTCFNLGGIQLQFNTTSREQLREAMERPDEYRNLVVRVSGFSAYFTGLDRAVQEDILARTEHTLV